MKKLSQDFEIKACCKASSGGFAFQRKTAGVTPL
jgi:hypothetical protein